MVRYLPLDIICSSEFVSFELRSRKTIRFSEEICLRTNILAYFRARVSGYCLYIMYSMYSYELVYYSYVLVCYSYALVCYAYALVSYSYVLEWCFSHDLWICCINRRTFLKTRVYLFQIALKLVTICDYQPVLIRNRASLPAASKTGVSNVGEILVL